MATIGIVGGGQLAKMLAQAAKPLGHRIIVYTNEPDSCAFSESTPWYASLDDHQQAKQFAEQCDFITCEFENIPQSLLECIGEYALFSPDANAFRIASNRKLEKETFTRIGLATPRYACVDDTSDQQLANANAVGYPVIAKSISGGYDGKGQKRCHNAHQLRAWLDQTKTSCLVEQVVDFAYEFSVIIARDSNKTMHCYPVVCNLHHQGILNLSIPLANHPIQQQAEDYARALVEQLDYIGVLALEMFVDTKGKILANEYAPRVHNSGHWSIEGATISQFTQHILAISNQNIQPVKRKAPCAMINLLGCIPEHLATCSLYQHAFIYNYGKAPRKGRKLGHITLVQQPNQTHTQHMRNIANVYEDIFQRKLKLPAMLSL